MIINWLLLAVVIVGVLILIIFIIKKNLKDKKQYEVFLNKNEYDNKNQDSEPNDTI